MVLVGVTVGVAVLVGVGLGVINPTHPLGSSEFIVPVPPVTKYQAYPLE